MTNQTAHFDDLPPADRAFAYRAQAQLRASEVLDFTESARLSAARQRAVAALDQRRAMPAWLLAPAAVAVVAVLIAFLPTRLSPPASHAAAVNLAALDALEWAVEEAGPEFYRDLEFYRWLDQPQNPEHLAEPNA